LDWLEKNVRINNPIGLNSYRPQSKYKSKQMLLPGEKIQYDTHYIVVRKDVEWGREVAVVCLSEF
jgi:hypothetical protein